MTNINIFDKNKSAMATQEGSSKESSRTLKMVIFSDDEDQGDDNSDMVTDSSSDNGSSKRCAICLGCIKGEVGSPDAVGCDHYFCLLCILEWAKNNATCPQDRRHFNKVLVMPYIGGSITEKIPVEVKKEDDAFDYTADDLTYCEVCGSCEREDCLLLCDGCDLGYHLECLTPPLSEVPIEEWFCPCCVKANLPITIGQSLLKEEKETSLLQMFQRPSTTSHKRLIPRTRATERVIQRIYKSRENKKNKRLSKRRKRSRKRCSEEDDSGEEGKDDKQYAFSQAFPTVKKYGSLGDDDIDAKFINDEWADKLLNPAPSTSLDNETKKFKAFAVLNNENKPSPDYLGHSYHPKINLSLPAMPDILTAILGSPTSFTSTPVAKPFSEEKRKTLDFCGSRLFLPIPLPAKKKEEKLPEISKKKENEVETSKKDDDLKNSEAAYDPMDELDKFDDVYDPLDDLEKFEDAYDPLEELEKSDKTLESLNDLDKSDVVYDHLERLEKSDVTCKSLEVEKTSETSIKPFKILDKSDVGYNPLHKLESSKLSDDSLDKLEVFERNVLDNKKGSLKKIDTVNKSVNDLNSKLQKKKKIGQNDKVKTLADKDTDKHASSRNKYDSPNHDEDEYDSPKRDKDKYDSSKYKDKYESPKRDKDKYDNSSKYKRKHSGKDDKYDSYSKDEKYYSYSKDEKHKSLVKGDKYDSYVKDGKFSHYSKSEKFKSYFKDEKSSRYAKDSKYVSSSKNDKYKHDYSTQRSKSKEKSSRKHIAKSKYDRDRSYSVERKRHKQFSRSSSSSSSSSSSGSSSRSRSKSRSKRNRSPESPDKKKQKAVSHSSKKSTHYNSKSLEKPKKKKLKSLWGHYYSDASDSWIKQPKDLQPSKHSIHSMNIPYLSSENKSTVIILSPDGQSNDRFSDSFNITEPSSSTPLGVVRIFSNEETSQDIFPMSKGKHTINEIVLDDSNSSGEKQFGYANVLKSDPDIKEKRAKSKKSKKKSKSKKKERPDSNIFKEKIMVDSNKFANELISDFDKSKEKELVDSNLKILTDASNIKILTDAFINEMAVLEGKKFFETKDIPGLTGHSDLFQREPGKFKPSLDSKMKKLVNLESSFVQKEPVKVNPYLEAKAEMQPPKEMVQKKKKKSSLIKNNSDGYSSKIQFDDSSDIFPRDSEKLQSGFKSKTKKTKLPDQSVGSKIENEITKLPLENKIKMNMLSESAESVLFEPEEFFKDTCEKQDVTVQSGFDQNKISTIKSFSDVKCAEQSVQQEQVSVKPTLQKEGKVVKSETQSKLDQQDPIILKPYLAIKNMVTGFIEPSKFAQNDTDTMVSDLESVNDKIESDIVDLSESYFLKDNEKLGLDKQSIIIQEPYLNNKNKMTECEEDHEPANLRTSRERKRQCSEQTVETLQKKEELYEQSKSELKLLDLGEKNKRVSLADKHELVDSEPEIILNESSHVDKLKINLKLKDEHINSQSSLDSSVSLENFSERNAKSKELMDLEELNYNCKLDEMRQLEDNIKLKRMKDIFGTRNVEEGSESPYDPCQEIEGSISVDEMSPYSIQSNSPKQIIENVNISVKYDFNGSRLELNSSQLTNTSDLNISSSPYSPSHSPVSSPEMKVKYGSIRKHKKLPDSSQSKNFMTKPTVWSDHKIAEKELKHYNSNSRLFEEDFKLSEFDSSLTEKLLGPPKINDYRSDFQLNSNKCEESKLNLFQREICNQKVKSFFVDDGLKREICDQKVKSFFDEFASPVKFDDSDSDDTVRSKLKKIDQNINKENVSHQSYAPDWSFNTSNDSFEGSENKKNKSSKNKVDTEISEAKKKRFEDSFIDSMESPESPDSDGEITLHPATLKLESKKMLADTESRSSRRLSSKNKVCSHSCHLFPVF